MWIFIKEIGFDSITDNDWIRFFDAMHTANTFALNMWNDINSFIIVR